MAAINVVISNLLQRNGDKSYCSLCFNLVKGQPVFLQDSVYVDPNHSEDLLDMLSCVIGLEHQKNLSILGPVCADCFKSIKFSYNFAKTCKENLKCLSNVVDSLHECFKDTVEDLDLFRSLFISVNTKDFSSKQYYDSQHKGGLSTALARYKHLAYKRQNTKKVPKIRNHKYSNDILKICNIIRIDKHSTYQCKVCDMTFSKSFNFKKHYFSQHSERRLKCQECDRSYGSDALLKQHIYDSHAKIICSVCGKSYKNRYSLLYHMRNHTGQKPYECKHCGKKFTWASRRAEHIRQFHTDRPEVTCDICQIKLRTLSSLYMHRKKHFDSNSKFFLQETPSVAEEVIIGS